MPTDERLAVDLLARTEYGRVAASLRAMPFLAGARHIVVDGRLLLRMHRGHGYPRACVGHVVAYGSDNLNRARPGCVEGRWSVVGGRWSVETVGKCAAVEPTAAELELFGPAPRSVDGGVPFDPVYLRVTPQFVTVDRQGATLKRPDATCEATRSDGGDLERPPVTVVDR
ncbi:pyridoxamine 5'-phosphate oxidase family protein [Streptomyces sp. NPDC048256]|uniref:pyridoxamine 5'-phosphate oxidase family protein n=1 Tax=Streptomyces sp. NPDC048256 TaxID=3154613 RepID=UPI0033D3E93C